jgi:gas vesicle protein
MTNTYYRVDEKRSGEGGGGFALGFVAGAMIGAGLGILFAPKAGSDLRRQLGEQADALANNASETYRKTSQGAAEWVNKAQESAADWAGKASEAADDLAQTGKSFYGKAREAFSKGAEEAQRYVREGGDGNVSPFPTDPGSTGAPHGNGASASYPSGTAGSSHADDGTGSRRS